MDRIVTIALPQKAGRVAAILASVVSALDDDQLYVTVRSDGLAVYSDSYRNLSSWAKKALK